jgi:hypothetical protein
MERDEGWPRWADHATCGSNLHGRGAQWVGWAMEQVSRVRRASQARASNANGSSEAEGGTWHPDGQTDAREEALSKLMYRVYDRVWAWPHWASSSSLYSVPFDLDWPGLQLYLRDLPVTTNPTILTSAGPMGFDLQRSMTKLTAEISYDPQEKSVRLELFTSLLNFKILRFVHHIDL